MAHLHPDGRTRRRVDQADDRARGEDAALASAHQLRLPGQRQFGPVVARAAELYAKRAAVTDLAGQVAGAGRVEAGTGGGIGFGRDELVHAASRRAVSWISAIM